MLQNVSISSHLCSKHTFHKPIYSKRSLDYFFLEKLLLQFSLISNYIDITCENDVDYKKYSRTLIQHNQCENVDCVVMF